MTDFDSMTDLLKGVLPGAEVAVDSFLSHLKANVEKAPLVVHESPGGLIKLTAKVTLLDKKYQLPLKIVAVDIAPTVLNDPDMLSVYLVSGVNTIMQKASEAGVAVIEATKKELIETLQRKQKESIDLAEKKLAELKKQQAGPFSNN